MKNYNNQTIQKFILKTKKSLNKDDIKILVGKHIIFTWYNQEENINMRVPGKVLEYNEDVVKILTSDIILKNNSLIDNKFIIDIQLKDISDVYVFDSFNNNYEKLIDKIELDEKDSIIKKIYLIENMQGDNLECIINDYDVFNLNFTCTNEKKELINIKYPLYLIKEINAING